MSVLSGWQFIDSGVKQPGQFAEIVAFINDDSVAISSLFEKLHIAQRSIRVRLLMRISQFASVTKLSVVCRIFDFL